MPIWGFAALNPRHPTNRIQTDPHPEFSVEYQTARSDIVRLVKVGILTELPGIRPRSFYASEIMRIAYNDLDTQEESGVYESATIEGDAIE